jgi:type IV pilus assembly protein PilE
MQHPTPAAQRRDAQRGFTLIELMITVAIIAIIVAVALPSYQAYVLRTHRSAASSCLTEMAQFMERVYAGNLRYDLNNGVATALPATQCRNDLATRYTIALDGGALTQRGFSLTATPQGAQAAGDAACGTLAIDQSGAKSVSGAGGVAHCWR